MAHSLRKTCTRMKHDQWKKKSNLIRLYYLSKLSGLTSRNDSREAWAALLTRQSIGPADCMADRVASQSARSTAIVLMVFTSADNESSPSLEREIATTSAPKLANCLASSRPIPAIFRIHISSYIIKDLIYAAGS